MSTAGKTSNKILVPRRLKLVCTVMALLPPTQPEATKAGNWNSADKGGTWDVEHD
jgi:hypothetical protein